MHACMHVCMYVCACLTLHNMYIYICVCRYVYIYTYIHIFEMYIFIFVHIYICTYFYMLIIYIYILLSFILHGILYQYPMICIDFLWSPCSLLWFSALRRRRQPWRVWSWRKMLWLLPRRWTRLTSICSARLSLEDHEIYKGIKQCQAHDKH